MPTGSDQRTADDQDVVVDIAEIRVLYLPGGQPLRFGQDDVFAELDARRRERLAEIVLEAGQVFVTAAVGDDLPSELSGERFVVRDGLVEPVSKPINVAGLGVEGSDATGTVGGFGDETGSSVEAGSGDE